MRNLIFISVVFMVYLGCRSTKIVEDPCPPTCPKLAICVDGSCLCADPSWRLINNRWCTPEGSFIAFINWYNCSDTFTFYLDILPDPFPDDNISTSAIVLMNSATGDPSTPFYEHSLPMSHEPLPDGDFISVPFLPYYCTFPNSNCNLEMLGKFRSIDTIDLTFRLWCSDIHDPAHGQSLKALAVRLK